MNLQSLNWLSEYSTELMVAAPTMGAPELGFTLLGPAPGMYVHEQ
ncbi:hypothetical protein AAKU55_001012 [Oxalobacteraceae bacterium GrIS 1.11]